MLSAAFNTLIALYSRPAQLKRLGTPDIFSLIRLTPSNYFRFLKGPEYTLVNRIEFIISRASAVGHLAQTLSFNKVPDAGNFKIGFGVLTTTSLPFNTTAADIQTAVRLLSGFSNTLVSGDFTAGFLFTFVGASSPVTLGDVTESTLANGADSSLVDTWANTNVPWAKQLVRGDRITDGSNNWTVDEIEEMCDIGAIPMGWRIRVS